MIKQVEGIYGVKNLSLAAYRAVVQKFMEHFTFIEYNVVNRGENKLNNANKLKEKVGQTSSNSLGQQCFGCQGEGHAKSECPTFLKSKDKAMAVTLSDDEIFDHESGSDEDENFFAFIAAAVVDESVLVEKNFSDGELSKSVDLQKVFNKLSKVAAKDAMSVDLGLRRLLLLNLKKKTCC